MSPATTASTIAATALSATLARQAVRDIGAPARTGTDVISANASGIVNSGCRRKPINVSPLTTSPIQIRNAASALTKNATCPQLPDHAPSVRVVTNRKTAATSAGNTK